MWKTLAASASPNALGERVGQIHRSTLCMDGHFTACRMSVLDLILS